MPRGPRVHVPNAVYHAILRGNHRQPIFLAPADYHRFENLLAEALLRHGCRLHAYCWMSNHVHMAVQVGDHPLGTLMHLVASRYARLTQRSVATTGHLFERRYRAMLIDGDSYLLTVVRYIHQNPVRAGIARTALEFRWSSHAAYLGAAAPPWLTTGLVRQLFGATDDDSRERYRSFMEVQPDAEELERLRGGRVAPTSHVATGLRPRPGLPAAVPEACRSIDDIINAELVSRRISVADLTGPGKRRALTEARAAIASQALAESGATLTDVARHLNRSPAALSGLLSRSRRKSSRNGT